MCILPDQVFVLRGPSGEPVWYAIVAGNMVRAEFNDKGAASAALSVEAARIERLPVANSDGPS